jgi:hypothetical protein
MVVSAAREQSMREPNAGGKRQGTSADHGVLTQGRSTVSRRE